MELNVEEAPNTSVVENTAANEDQNTTEEDAIQKRLTNIEGNLQKLTENVTEILKKQEQLIENETTFLKKQEQMTENETNLFSKLSQLAEKVNNLAEDKCRNNNRNKSKKNFILINKKAVMVNLDNQMEVQTKPEGDGQAGRNQVVKQEENPQWKY